VGQARTNRVGAIDEYLARQRLPERGQSIDNNLKRDREDNHVGFLHGLAWRRDSQRWIPSQQLLHPAGPTVADREGDIVPETAYPKGERAANVAVSNEWDFHGGPP
jgi:hypothetical protein